ncbi:MAG: Gfo/Idh/MocA family oxidoreductase [Bryobacteraceae bacterium]|nr:Gfo/Idh/MocA family oxidoreductase [Bryobacteraceae bacterium]
MSDKNVAETNDLTRRDVVKIAGAATVVAAAGQIQGAPFIQKVKAANNQVQYGMVGTGSRGSYLLKHLKGIDNGRCVAICDINDTALGRGAETIGNNPRKYKDYRELLAQKDIDAVFVVTPLFEHFRVTKDVLLSGKHVFCEKSLVFKPEEVHALRQLSHERPKQVLQVGLQRRYSKMYQAARQMIEKGLLGEVTHVQAQWHRNPGWKMKADQPKLANWRLFREYSGGLVAELASHQIDVADWMLGMTPESVLGDGALDFSKDGRDVYDQIQLIYRYPKGRRLVYTSIPTCSHLPLLNGQRNEMGEMIMGTQGAIHITVGFDEALPTGIWFQEPNPPKVDEKKKKDEKWVAGATMKAAKPGQSLPILLDRDLMSGKESFIEKEMKFARRWLYSKGIMVPEEDVNPVDTQLASFFEDVKAVRTPRANLEVGLQDSIAVILSNLAMDEQRRVYFNEIEKMGRTPAEAKPAAAAPVKRT